jgi:hypothetical protein
MVAVAAEVFVMVVAPWTPLDLPYRVGVGVVVEVVLEAREKCYHKHMGS